MKNKILSILCAAVIAVSGIMTISCDVSAEWVKTKLGYTYKDEKTGKRLTGWQTIDGGRYYFSKKGVVLTGWQTLSGKKYYFDPAKHGKAVTGWTKNGDVYRYFNKKGVMCTTRAVQNGKSYSFTSDGIFVGVVNNKNGIVPINELSNLKSLKKSCTDEEFKQAYNNALKIVEPLVGMSVDEQLLEIAYALRMKVENGEVTYSTSEKHYSDPYGYFVSGVGSCAGCARATGLCLNMLGISYEHVNENQWSHQWCRVKVGTEYYICDAYGLYVGKEPGIRKHPYL